MLRGARFSWEGPQHQPGRPEVGSITGPPWPDTSVPTPVRMGRRSYGPALASLQLHCLYSPMKSGSPVCCTPCPEGQARI